VYGHRGFKRAFIACFTQEGPPYPLPALTSIEAEFLQSIRLSMPGISGINLVNQALKTLFIQVILCQQFLSVIAGMTLREKQDGCTII
jgi:hypothetical protein